LILSDWGNSETRSTLPNVSWLTSASMWLGMSAAALDLDFAQHLFHDAAFLLHARRFAHEDDGTLTFRTLSSAMRFRSI